jgi:alkylglycerol monooxygenase
MNMTSDSSPISKFYTLRAMFYLLLPSETYKESMNQVHEIIDAAVTPFIGLILIEQILLVVQNGSASLRINDGVSSLSAGIVSRIPK